MTLGPHADFIIASYALTAFVIAALIAVAGATLWGAVVGPVKEVDWAAE